MMLLSCLAAMWLAGFGLVRWMFPQPHALVAAQHLAVFTRHRVGRGHRIVLVFFDAGAGGAERHGAGIGDGAAVVIALALGAARQESGHAARLGHRRVPAVPWYLTALFVLAIVLALTMFLGAVGYNPHGDEGAWSIWNLRARFLFRAGAFWRDAFSSDLAWTHPDYPLLLPGAGGSVLEAQPGRNPPTRPSPIAFLFSLGTAGLLVSALGALRGKAHALLAGTILLGTASFIALSAALYGDVPLSFYILATLALICLQDRHPDNLRFSALAGLMAGFAAWTRNEGIVLRGGRACRRVPSRCSGFESGSLLGASATALGARFGGAAGRRDLSSSCASPDRAT